MPPTQTIDSSVSSASSKVDKETVIIFDWDDTLLSSSYLSGKGFRLDTDKSRLVEVEAGLKELELSVINVLSLALSHGTVHVITNAETGWVQLSAQKFIPGVLPLLQRVNILSARSTYEGRYPDSPLKWKFYAFQERLTPSFSSQKRLKNILSFGDSHVEREAVRAVTRGVPNTRCKSVKFAERPSMDQLRKQIELVSNCFQYIFNHEGDLDLQLTVTIGNGGAGGGGLNNFSTSSAVAPSTLSHSFVPTATHNVLDPSGNYFLPAGTVLPQKQNGGEKASSSSSSSSSTEGSTCDGEARQEIAENEKASHMQTTEEKPISISV